jgi:predicted metalloprotease with PDZ domain
MANFPNWAQTVTSGMKSSTIMRLIITNYILLQSQIRNAIGAYGSFDNYMKAMYTSAGYLIPDSIQHDVIKNITASQHHTQHHATTHITATDPIPIGSSTKHGLISTTKYIRLLPMLIQDR